MLIDDGFAVDAMSERFLMKLGMRLSRTSSIIVGMTNKLKIRPFDVVHKVVMSVREVQALLSFQIHK